MTVFVRAVGIATMASVITEMQQLCFADLPEQAWGEVFLASLAEGPGMLCLMASDGPDRGAWPIGFVILRGAGAEAEILSLGVLPPARRRGVASLMLQAVLVQAAEAGARSVFLEVLATNGPAIGLYRRSGFTMVGRRPGYYRSDAGKRVDAIVMYRGMRSC